MLPLLLAALVGWLPLASPGGPVSSPVAGHQIATAVGPYQGGAVHGPVLGGGCVGPGCGGPDFNPILLGGNKGYPGLRARINPRMFQYASGIIGELLNKQIQRARVPDIVQSTQPMVEGCVVLYNAYVSRYRCPQRIVIFPKPPNHVVLQVQNMDVGITGNLGGSILNFIQLSGIAQINIHGITLAVEIVIENGPRGPRLKICSCAASVSFVDICIENGGLVGSLFNSFFKRTASTQIQNMLPEKLCQMLPEQLDKQINSRAGAIPQAIALTQMAMLAGGGLSSSPPRPNPEFCEKQCGVKQSATATMGGGIGTAPVAPQIPQTAYGNSGGPKAVRSALPPQSNHRSLQHLPLARQTVQQPQRRSILSQTTHQATSPVETPRVVRRTIPTTRDAPVVANATGIRHKRATEILVPRMTQVNGPNTVQLPARTNVRRSASKIVRTRGSAPTASSSLKVVSSSQSPMCNQCTMAADDPAGFIRDFAQNLNLAKLNDMFLSVQLMNTYATNNDAVIDLTGEFSPGGQGGTPFGAFPTMFPAPYDNHMAEAIVSDYTVNSLLYWMHKKGFLSFRVGPETPKIGELLKTTCSEESEDDLDSSQSGKDELEGSEVQIDEEEARKRKIKRRHLQHFLAVTRHKRATVVRTDKQRVRRQEDPLGGGSLSDLGICFGDILPAVREKYPNKKIYIQIHSIRAPSLILSRKKGGTASVDVAADADIYIEGNNIKVGTITVVAGVDVAIQLRGNRVYGMGEITNLKLTDSSGTLGLPQDALDNLGTLGKELITKLANDALMKGIPINVSQSPSLPISFYNPQAMIIEHGIYVAGDITVAPALLGTLGGAGSCYRY